MSKKVPKITLHWGMAKAMWPSQSGSAWGGQRSTNGHKTHPNNNHCHAHSSEGYNMGWATLDRWSTLCGVVQAPSHVCSRWDWLGLPGSDGLAHMSGGVYWLSAGPFAVHASHPPAGYPELLYMTVECPKKARSNFGSCTASLLQDSAGQSKPQASPDPTGGEEQ